MNPSGKVHRLTRTYSRGDYGRSAVDTLQLGKRRVWTTPLRDEA
jgi:hypothetical protein